MSVPLVVDPYGVAGDPALARYAIPALDPAIARPELAHALGLPPHGFRLLAIRVLRHKRGRRCLIAYDGVMEARPGPELVRLLGKLRAKGADERAYLALQALAQAGFGSHSELPSIPLVAGIVPRLGLWLQTRVPGEPSLAALLGIDGCAAAGRIGAALHALHGAPAPAYRYTVADELATLRERLDALAAARPALAERLRVILAACHAVAAVLPAMEPRGIHRDCYFDNLLVEAEHGRIWFVDLDLYAAGDPALDVGNFIAHLMEWSLRAHGRADVLDARAWALEERYLALAGEGLRSAVATWTTLALARHIAISAAMPERGHVTLPLLALCEQRLGIPSVSYVRLFS